MLSELKIKNKKILVFSAHPDDAEFFAGGTLAKLSMVNDIGLVAVTSGEKGLKKRFKNNRVIREDEQKRSCKVLGINYLKFLKARDGNLKYSNELDNRVCEVIEKYKPQVIFSFDPWNENEVHPDHRILGFSVIDSLIACNLDKVVIESLYLYNPYKTDVYSNINKFMDKKIDANKCHMSQHSEYESGWREKKEILIKIAKLYGKYCNIKFAEVYRKLSVCPSRRYLINAVNTIKAS